MRDRTVAEPVLDRPGIGASVGQCVSSAMPQHVEMHRQGKAGPLADDLDEPVDGIGRERGAALGGEDVAAVRIFLAQRGQHAQLVAADGMDRRLAFLGAPYVQGSRSTELDLGPFQLAGFLGSQTVPVGHKDQCRVPMPPAAVLGRLDQLLDLGRRQILPGPQRGIRATAQNRINFPIYVT